MRFVALGVALVSLGCVPAAHAATAITACNQVVHGGAAYLTSDLDCAWADYGVRFEGAGVLDLGGFTLKKAGVGVSCELSCNVRNGVLEDTHTGIASNSRAKVTNVEIRPNESGINIGVAGSTGAVLKNVTLTAREGVVADYGPVKLDHVTITNCLGGVRTQKSITAIDSTITAPAHYGLQGSGIRLIRSSATGAGTDANCNMFTGEFSFLLCGDLMSWKRPTVRLSTCDTSLVLSSNINLGDPENWHVCSTD